LATFFLNKYLNVFIIFEGIKLAIEISKSAKSNTLKDFKENMNEESFKQKMHALREMVENFAIEFPMPGYDEV
jgi:hypothetical protein